MVVVAAAAAAAAAAVAVATAAIFAPTLAPGRPISHGTLDAHHYVKFGWCGHSGISVCDGKCGVVVCVFRL